MESSSLLFHDWSGIARTAVVGVLAYVTLVLFLRISGKRTLAKLNAFDLVVTVALGSTLSTILLQESVALAEGAAALAVLILLQYVATSLSVRSAAFARIVRSEPALLLRHGRVYAEALRSERISAHEILSAVRATGGHSLSDAESVVLESDGSLSVSLRSGRPSPEYPDAAGPGKPIRPAHSSVLSG